MRPIEILQLLRQQPFRPFRICVSDGTVYHIRHPEFVALAQSVAKIHQALPGRDDAYPDQYVLVSYLHITRLDLTEGA